MAKRIKKPTRKTSGIRPFAHSLIRGMEEAIQHARGHKTAIAEHVVYPKVPGRVDVRSIRKKLGMTQEQFTAFGFSLSAIRHWESRRREPEGAARVLLMVIARNPELVLRTLHG